MANLTTLQNSIDQLKTTNQDLVDVTLDMRNVSADARDTAVSSAATAVAARDAAVDARTGAEALYGDLQAVEAAKVAAQTARTEAEALYGDLAAVEAARDEATQAASNVMTSVAEVVPLDVAWDPVADTHTRFGANTTGETPVHRDMRRCVLNDDGTVNYYLDPNDSTLKADGTAADLSGADGQVVVEVPRTYVRYSEVNGQKRWQVSPNPMYGFVLHPAFKVGGTPALDTSLGFWTVSGHTHEVQHRYVGAYNASVFDVSASAYIDGLNLDNNDARVDISTDKLSSVSGTYPMVGLTRAQFRALAANRGGQWNQLDFWLQQLLLILFITEHAGFDGQTLVGSGNVDRSYPTSSEVQADSPHTAAGVSNSLGNGTGDGGEPDPFVSWRGIENFWGQCWQWMDGLNINENVPYVCGDPTQFADNTTAGYAALPAMPGTNGYVRDVHGSTLSFLPSDSSGSSSAAFADYYYQSTGWRVAFVGGTASHGLLAGPFALHASTSSSYRYRGLGGRLAAWGPKTAV